jgi:hypothetical protein
MPLYEAPTITEIGTVAELTQGDGWRGNHDSRTFFGVVTVHYGQPPTS